MATQGGPGFVPRVSMYDAQAQNRWRTVLLIAGFTVIVVAVAFVFGDILGGSANAGLVFIPAPIAFSPLSSLFSHYAGDKLALPQPPAPPLPHPPHHVLPNAANTPPT